MVIHQIITWAYQAILGFFCLLLVVKIVRSRAFEQQLLAAIVLIPFVLRLLFIK
jgi:hypothetical protein